MEGDRSRSTPLTLWLRLSFQMSHLNYGLGPQTFVIYRIAKVSFVFGA